MKYSSKGGPLLLLVGTIYLGVASNPDIDPNIEAIKTQTLALPLNSNFEGDEVLQLKVDRINGISNYKYHSDKKSPNANKTLFSRKESDFGKTIVILSANEDHLYQKNKRTYVVLKKDPTKPIDYKLFYAYVRDGADKIEFDTWDGRGASKSLTKSLGWACSLSVFTGCYAGGANNTKAPAPEPVSDYSGEVEGGDEGQGGESKTATVPSEVKKRTGLDPSSTYYDLFFDLDMTESDLEMIYKTVGTFTYTLVVSTAISSRDTIIKSGIKPTDAVNPEETAAIKKADIILALTLFQRLTNDSQIEHKIPSNPDLKKSVMKDPNEQINSTRGGLLNGEILKTIIGTRTKRSLDGREAREEQLIDETGLEKEAVSKMSLKEKRQGFFNNFFQKGSDFIINHAIDVLGIDGISDIGDRLSEAVDPEGNIKKFKAAAGVGGVVVDRGLKAIPFFGDSMASVASMMGGKAMSALNWIGIGRSIGDGPFDPSQTLSKTSLFDRIGWRTGDINSEELATLSEYIDFSFPYIGFGTCPPPTSLPSLNAAESNKKIVKYFTTVLRIDCLPDQTTLLVSFITSGLLRINSDKSLSPDSGFYTYADKLSRKDVLNIYGALEFSQFTKVLLGEIRFETPAQNPDGTKISKTVHIFTQTALGGLQEASKILPKHFIKVARSVVVTLKTGFTKALQDYFRYKACSKCVGNVQDLGHHDLLAIMGVLQFTLNGLGPVDAGTKDVQTAYKEFYLSQKDKIEDKIKIFL